MLLVVIDDEEADEAQSREDAERRAEQAEPVVRGGGEERGDDGHGRSDVPPTRRAGFLRERLGGDQDFLVRPHRGLSIAGPSRIERGCISEMPGGGQT